MIYVQKLNVVLRVEDEKLGEYLGMGYVQLDENGTCIDPSDNISEETADDLTNAMATCATDDESQATTEITQKRTRKPT